MSDKATFYTTTFDEKNIVGAERISVTLDLTEYTKYEEVRIVAGEHIVTTTPEHLIECVLWLLTNVDTNTLVTRDGIEVDEIGE